MIRRGNESLQASASARIRTHTPGDGRGPSGRTQIPAHAHRSESTGQPALSLEDWAALLPWGLGRSRLGHRWILGGGLALCGTLLVLLLPVPAVFVLLPIGFGGGWVHRELHSSRRRAAELVGVLEDEMTRGAELRSLRPLLEEVLQLDAENDGARFLLACILLEEGRSLSALLQLAPLRERHPNAGEVLFLAAEAYVALELFEEALRLLDALDIEDEHPCHGRVARLQRYCAGALPPERGGPATPMPQQG